MFCCVGSRLTAGETWTDSFVAKVPGCSETMPEDANVATACSSVTSAVLIPSVKKGLCNQRMRMVQDIVIAHLLGAAVILPEVVFSREDCNFKAECYSQYTGMVPFANVYDVENASRALAAVGVCTLSRASAATRFQSSNLKLSQLQGALTLPASTSELQDAAASLQKMFLGRVWSVAASTACCTLVVPDSQLAVHLLRKVAAAFVPAARIASMATQVLERFYARAHTETAAPVAIHWRGQSDMAASSHALNITTYTHEAARMLVHMLEQLLSTEGPTRRTPLCLLILGGSTASELAKLHTRLSGAFGHLRDNALRLYSKETLMPEIKWSHHFGGYDDLVGVVDLEIARKVQMFIGSPFSSFSVVAAAVRALPCSATSGCTPSWKRLNRTASGSHQLTRMVPVDVSDQLGRIFSLHFPYTDDKVGDRCKALAGVHDWHKPGGWSCPSKPLASRSSWADAQSPSARPRHPRCDVLGASLRVNPPIDAPSRLGFNCTIAVITALYGGYDTLHGYSRSFQTRLGRQEREYGVRTCWFAFVDAASVPELSAQQIALAERAFNTTALNGGPWVQSGVWNLVMLPEGQMTAMLPEHNQLRSRLPKLMAHCVLAYAKTMLYIDAKIRLSQPASLWTMVEQLNARGDGPGSAWVSPRHPHRSSVRDELVCLYLSGIVSERAFAQLRAYHAAGFPSVMSDSAGGPGLIEGEWHARDLQAAESTALANEWFHEWWRWREYNTRDQISFNYAAWRLGFLPPQNQTQGSGSKVAQPQPRSSKVRSFAHFKAPPSRVVTLKSAVKTCDADSEAWSCYLKRYADLGRSFHGPAAARRHFIQYGYKEKRICQCDGNSTYDHTRSLYMRYSHNRTRASLGAEDALLASRFAFMGPREVEILRSGHRWCAFPTFALDNAGLIYNLQGLLGRHNLLSKT